MDRLQVLVVDDHQLVLEAVRAVLDDDGEVEIVGEALSGTEALAILEREQPDVVLLDLRMPGMSGLECLDEIRERFPAVRVVFLSGSEDDELALEALERGASAFVSKNVEPRDLSAVLRQVVEGSVLSSLGMAIEPRGARAAKEAGLTAREGEVLAALAEGRSNKQIALAAQRERAGDQVSPDERLPKARDAEPGRGASSRDRARLGRSARAPAARPLESAAVTGPVRELRLAVTVENYDEAVRFYRDVLGLPVIQEWAEPAGSGAILDAGHATLELLSVDQTALVDRVEVGAEGVSPPIRLALEVVDSEATAQRLVEAGAEQLADAVTTPWRHRNVRVNAPGPLQLTLFTVLDHHSTEG